MTYVGLSFTTSLAESDPQSWGWLVHVHHRSHQRNFTFRWYGHLWAGRSQAAIYLRTGWCERLNRHQKPAAVSDRTRPDRTRQSGERPAVTWTVRPRNKHDGTPPRPPTDHTSIRGATFTQNPLPAMYRHHHIVNDCQQILACHGLYKHITIIYMTYKILRIHFCMQFTGNIGLSRSK